MWIIQDSGRGAGRVDRRDGRTPEVVLVDARHLEQFEDLGVSPGACR